MQDEMETSRAGTLPVHTSAEAAAKAVIDQIGKEVRNQFFHKN